VEKITKQKQQLTIVVRAGLDFFGFEGSSSYSWVLFVLGFFLGWDVGVLFLLWFFREWGRRGFLLLVILGCMSLLLLFSFLRTLVGVGARRYLMGESGRRVGDGVGWDAEEGKWRVREGRETVERRAAGMRSGSMGEWLGLLRLESV